MKTRLVRIGNSRGIRLPQPLILEAGLEGEVEIHVQDGTVVLWAAQGARAGWAEAARALQESKRDGLLDPAAPTRFDEEEWEW
jgi:antitoxin MazE